MIPRLTASDFHKWLKCPNWIYWDIFGNPADKGEVPKLIEKLRDEGVLHEKKIVEALGPLTEVEDLGSAEANAARTLELMKTGAVIYQGTLLEDDWIGRPDLLMPIEGESKLGPWIYEPVDIKAAYEIRDSHKLQLTFYAHLLENEKNGLAALPPEACKLLLDHDTCKKQLVSPRLRGGIQEPGLAASWQDPGPGIGLRESAQLSQISYGPED